MYIIFYHNLLNNNIYIHLLNYIYIIYIYSIIYNAIYYITVYILLLYISYLIHTVFSMYSMHSIHPMHFYVRNKFPPRFRWGAQVELSGMPKSRHGQFQVTIHSSVGLPSIFP
jgi:hypothetical protein